MVAKIATHEIAEETEDQDDGKDKAAADLGKRGGKARATKLSSQQRRKIAQKAARKRWNKSD